MKTDTRVKAESIADIMNRLQGKRTFASEYHGDDSQDLMVIDNRDPSVVAAEFAWARNILRHCKIPTRLVANKAHLRCKVA